MQVYLNLLKDILENGIDEQDRTGTGTRSVFGRQVRYDLSKGFPVITTKKINLNAVIHELLWFIKGDTNIKYLKDNGVNIWNEWADTNGDLGHIYGKQWRSWGSGDHIKIDQLKNVINEIKTNPSSRRLIVSAWNVGELSKMALPPCHTFFQFYVRAGKLSCQLYQRSADMFLGVPFNISSYSLLTYMVASITGLEVGDFVHTMGDTHIYHNHFEQVQLQLSRDCLDLPVLELNKSIQNIDDFTFNDIKIINYNSHPFIKGLVSV